MELVLRLRTWGAADAIAPHGRGGIARCLSQVESLEKAPYNRLFLEGWKYLIVSSYHKEALRNSASSRYSGHCT